MTEVSKIRSRWSGVLPTEAVVIHLEMPTCRIHITGDSEHPVEVKIDGANVTKEQFDAALALVDRVMGAVRESNII